jgi:ubiquinone/menaquinone biosynthesis C-methylase UbiE
MPDTLYDKYDYIKYWKGRDYEDRAEKLALSKLFKLIRSRENIIDIGGGFGRHAVLYAPEFENCVIAEPSEKLLKEAQERLSNFTNIEYVRAFGQSLPFENNKFDVALLIRVIHHIQKPEEVLNEVYRILKPGGYFIIEVANKIHFLARLRAYLRRDFRFVTDLTPIDIRSEESKKRGDIIVLNHHPQKIIFLLKQRGFKIHRILSVSNFRLGFCKKVIPLKLLMFLENITQSILAKIFFGPSIIILARKKEKAS